MLIIIIILVLIIFASTNHLNSINKFLNKIKKIQNIIILVFSIISLFNFQNISKKLIKTNHQVNKRNISNSTKKFIASNQQWKCNMCKNILDHTYEIDHIKPLYKGGDNENTNLQALCRNCHGKKTFIDLS